MHQPRIVRHDPARHRHQVDGCGKVGASAQVDGGIAGLRGDVVADFAILVGTEQPYRDAACSQAFGEVGKVVHWPAFGRAVLGARTEHGHRFAAIESQARHGDEHVGFIHRKVRHGETWRHRITRFLGQLGIAIGHQRQLVLVQLVHDVQQAVARLADEAHAQRNVGKERDQGGLEGVGQHHGLIVMLGAQAAPQPPAIGQAQRAMREVGLDDAADFRHARHNGRGPGRGEGVERDAGQALMNARQQRLRQQRVADPVRRDDQDAGHVKSAPAIRAWQFGYARCESGFE